MKALIKNCTIIDALPLGLGISLYLMIIILFIPNYFVMDANVYMGLSLAPYILVIAKRNYSFRYFIPFLLLLIVQLFVPVKSLFFLSLLFAILLLIESTMGKLNNIFILYLLLLSPIYKYFSNFIGFPTRLWLSQLSGTILSSIGMEIDIAGNMISMDNTEFSVDAACAGLNMMTTSLMIAMLIIAYYQRKLNTNPPFSKVVLFLSTTFTLNAISNLLRIIFLIFFKIMPDNRLHELVGILFLIIYVILPLIYFSKYLFKKTKSKKIVVQNSNIEGLRRSYFLNIFFALILYAVGHNIILAENPPTINDYALKGFKKEILKNGVTKLENKKTLIYIKPVKFYSAEHNPMICWSGSGYEFKKIMKKMISGVEIYTGVIEKEKEKIYTAWWFDNGNIKTTNQFQWRWDAINTNTNYFLLNVSTVSEEQLFLEINKLLQITNYCQNKT